MLGECGKDTGPHSLQERQQLAYILASQVQPMYMLGLMCRVAWCPPQPFLGA